MSTTAKACAIVLATAFLVQLTHTALAANADIARWLTIKSERHGYAISYPAHVFSPRPDGASEDGTVLMSSDGAAKLIVAAFDNEQRTSMSAYRRLLLNENYTGAVIDYAPIRKRWFVLSGERDGVMFYERVSFTCGGRLINSWAMIYPVVERAVYDRLLERIARTYKPGRGANGNCR